jgi:hypothetical protein
MCRGDTLKEFFSATNMQKLRKIRWVLDDDHCTPGRMPLLDLWSPCLTRLIKLKIAARQPLWVEYLSGVQGLKWDVNSWIEWAEPLIELVVKAISPDLLVK